MRTVLSGLLILLLRMVSGQAGTVDPTFLPQMGSPSDSVYDVVCQPDGKVIIAGGFTVVQGVQRKRIARLFADGTLDPSFDPGSGADAGVAKILLQPDGRILLYGAFTVYNGSPKARLARVMPDGALDPTFDAGTGFSGQGLVYDWVLQTDGKLLIVGDFTGVNGQSSARVVRLLASGAVDPAWSFGTGTGAGPLGNTVNCVAVQPNGRILIGGYFVSVQGAPSRSLARLTSNGSVESQFLFDQSIGFTMDNSAGLVGQVFSIQVQPDGNILVAGAFNEYRGVATGPMIRMSSGGVRDNTFAPFPAYFTPDHVFAMRMLPDGRCITVNSSGVIKRICIDGTIDPNFTSYTGLTGYQDLGPQPDGGLVLSDPFVRLRGDASGALPVSLNVLLGGPFDGSSALMSDGLRAAGLIPRAQPYTTGNGFTQVGSGGNERVPPWSLTATGANALVDWVMVELRDQPTHVAMTRCGLVQRDGDVVGVDGTSPLYFLAPPGNYHIAVRHRNHLGVMSATAIPLSTTLTTVDFTLPTTTTYGTGAQNQIGARMVLWAGNTTTDNMVKYTGSANDRDVVLTAVGSTTPNNTVSNAYSRSDTNMDGAIKYTGSGNDRDIILLNVGSTTPNNTRTQQLP